MKNKLIHITIILVLVFLAGCEKPYAPPVAVTNLNLLVVDGVINTGTDSTIIKLSRTTTIGSNKTAAETKATVTVENAQGTVNTLTEIAAGTYASAPLALDNTKQYRLRIKTSNGKTYLSDLVDAKVAPPIDSVGYIIKNGGIQLYVNSHDATNNSRYYKYTYQETWQFHTKFNTPYISDGTTLSVRTPAQSIFYCFAGDNSTNTLVNSTASLTQDETYQFPITFVDGTTEKLQVRYSILVTQQALTKEAYLYWDNLRKNTQLLGGIFDALPSQLTGNIHNITDANETVVGYIGAGSPQHKRVFIDKTELPVSWQTADLYNCQVDTLGVASVYFLIRLPAQAYGVSHLLELGVDKGYTITTIPCADCRTRGTLLTPSFWK